MVTLICDICVETLSGTGALQKQRTVKGAEVRVGKHVKTGELSVFTTVKGNELAFSIAGAVSIHKRFLQQGKAAIRVLKPSTQILLSKAVPEELLEFLECTIALKEGRSYVPRRSPLADRDSNRQCDEQMDKTTPNKRVLNRNSLFQKRERVVITPARKQRLVSELSLEQREVFNIVMDGKSIFFTGGAGTGKSFLLRRIIEALPADTTFATSTTGVAATNINATTIQSFTGILEGIYDATRDLKHCLGQAKRRAEQWRICKVMVIDEVSMMDAEYLEKMEAIARILRHSSLPFGGIQLVFCGDFLQLPPVSKDPANRKRYCFQSPVWNKCVPHVFELRQVFRQKDPEFVRMLRKLRVGLCTPDVEQMLKDTRKNELGKDGILPTELCTHVGGVDAANQKFLSQLPGQAITFQSSDYYRDQSTVWIQKQLDHTCPAPKTLELKIGAQVMLVKNLDFKGGLVNGSRGVIVRFTSRGPDGKGGNQLPVVRFISGRDVEVGPETWSVVTSGYELAARTQIPLKLSWSLSIHKSQGMSLDCVKVDISRVFEHGQAYVALSRARTLDRLLVTNFSPKSITADPVALKFYKSLREKQKAATVPEDDKENAPCAS